MPAAVHDIDERLALIERNTAEVLGRDDLRALLAAGAPLQHYIGYEISGRVHLGSIVGMSKVRDLQRAGVRCRVFLADWHTWINDKLGGDRDVIRSIASGYFAEAHRAALMCVGGDVGAVELVLASDLYIDKPDYWATVIEVSKNTSLARMQRSISILGRQEGEQVDFAKLIYPAMQAADIFAQGVHIAHAGIDQRKAHVIARDVATQLRVMPLRGADGAKLKPCAVHHPLILGLRKPPVWPVPAEGLREVYTEMKMSKSDPNAAVFIHDDPDQIRAKVRRAFCPPQTVELNPVLDWVERLIFGVAEAPFEVRRSEANGGDVRFTTYTEVRDAYAAGMLHPMDTKDALADFLIQLLEPARLHFRDPERAAMLDEVNRVG